MDWRPYHPVCTDRVAVRAQGVAATLRLTSAPAVADYSLTEVLQRAKDLNELAILIVDPWSTQLPECADVLSMFDAIRSAHAAVLVPWETASEQSKDDGLEDSLMARLGNWAEAGKDVFRSRVDTIELFTDTLGGMIEAGRARLVRYAEVARRAAEAGPVLRPKLDGAA